MNQKLISNQEVFGSVQPATLKIEPDFKSTILYSNRFASNSSRANWRITTNTG